MILRTPEMPHQPPGDYYVRLSGAELQELQLELQWTQWPAADDVESMGYAEWAGSLRGAVVSLGCYWRLGADGHCDCRDPYDVSSNLMLVDAEGCDTGTSGTSAVLIDFVRETLVNAPWGLLTGSQRPLASVGRLQ